MSRIMMIGTGYVGLVSGACLAEFGNKVVCYDIDHGKIEGLEKGKVPFYEPGLEDMVIRNRDEGRLRFSTDLAKCVADSTVIFIAVGTPEQDDGTADLSAVFAVAGDIADHMEGFKVIVQKSTVPVGTTRKLGDLIREKTGGQADFELVSNPEFLREGSAIEDFLRPNRVVFGFSGPRATDVVEEVYHPLYADGTPVLSTNLESAEMVKYASNAFLATKVSFINEVAELCEKVGADVQVVARGMGMDTRIGAKFLHAGTGFGGSCFPKDTIALVKMGDSYGVDMSLVKSTIGANERQSSRAVGKLRALVGGELAGLRIAVLGLSFKPNTDDVREASSLKIIQQLWDEGAKVVAYDPVAGANAQRAMPDLELAPGVDDCVTGADGLILATEWSEFRLLDMKKIASQLAHPRVVDCRNIYRPEQMEELGIAYDSFGRRAVDV